MLDTRADFAGDFPGSKSRIPLDAGPVRIFLQGLFGWILPGTVVEVLPVTKEPNKDLSGLQTVEDYDKLVTLGLARPRNGPEAASGITTPRFGQGVNEWDPDTLDIVSAIDKAFADPAKVKKSRRKRGMSNDTLENAAEESFLDVVADLVSGRFVNFYMVPIVRFTMHFASHIAFVLFLSIFMLVDLGEELSPPV